jgi:hypothetical protein
MIAVAAAEDVCTLAKRCAAGCHAAGGRGGSVAPPRGARRSQRRGAKRRVPAKARRGLAAVAANVPRLARALEAARAFVRETVVAYGIDASDDAGTAGPADDAPRARALIALSATGATAVPLAERALCRARRLGAAGAAARRGAAPEPPLLAWADATCAARRRAQGFREGRARAGPSAARAQQTPRKRASVGGAAVRPLAVKRRRCLR